MSLLNAIPCAFAVTDRQGVIKRVNDELILVLGGQEADWVDLPMDHLLTPASRIFTQTHAWPSLLRDGTIRELYLTLQPLGNVPVPVMINAKTSEIDGESCAIWVFFVALERSRFEAAILVRRQRAESISEQALENKRQLSLANEKLSQKFEQSEQTNLHLKHLSFTDPLTGLGNRRALELAAEINAKSDPSLHQSSVVFLLDIDFFKLVNDRWGHDTGDRVLVAIGRCLKSCARSNDTVVRYGGEEFAILLSNTTADQVQFIGKRILDQVRQLNPEGIPTTVSIGWSAGRIQSQEDLTTMLKQADAGLYAAKRSGKDRLVQFSA